MKERKLTIALLGLGTVGSSLVRILAMRKKELKEQYGLQFDLKKVLEQKKVLRRNAGLGVPKKLLTARMSDILEDPEIDTVIELIGGLSPAREFILQALKKKKNVVTANKRVLAEDGDRIIREARKNSCILGARAAITGCHSIIQHLAYGGTIKDIVGILNGTCNYILMEMESKNEDFGAALAKAQYLGYAERDASMDIDGHDTFHKLAIIALLMFGYRLKAKDIHIEGIRGITLQDVQSVTEHGYRIKLVGVLRTQGDKVDVRVHPALVKRDTPLFSSLKGVGNCIQINDELRGVSSVSAEGAGGPPAASAALADLIAIANGESIPWKGPRKFSLAKTSSITCRYYLRFQAVDKPKVLGELASVLGKSGINITSAIQREKTSGSTVPLSFITDKAIERDVRKALKQIARLSVTSGKPKLIRIEDGLLPIH